MAVSSIPPRSRMSPLGIRILTQLEDGEWHDVEDVIEAVQYTIPPGEAFRVGQKISTAAVDRRPMDEVIESGRRSLVVTQINNLTNNGRMEKAGDGPRGSKKLVRVVRKVPLIYVVRQPDGTLQVFPHSDETLGVHVIDTLAEESSNPKEDALTIKRIFDGLPFRLNGKAEVQRACRYLMNRHNIAAALKELEADPDPDDHETYESTYTDRTAVDDGMNGGNQ